MGIKIQFTDVTKGTEMSEAVVKGAALLAYAPIIKGQRGKVACQTGTSGGRH
jgi:hypothetical protein